jgi:hypothetical protein
MGVADVMLSGRASLLQGWLEGALSLARRHPLLLTFLQDDGTFTEESQGEPAVTTGAGLSAEKETAEEQAIAEYRCLRRCQIRAEAAMDSEKVGILDMGETVVVFEEKKLESGAHRVRFDQGWCSLETADGTTVLAKRSSSSSATASAGNTGDVDPDTRLDSNVHSPPASSEGAKAADEGEEQPASTGAPCAYAECHGCYSHGV